MLTVTYWLGIPLGGNFDTEKIDGNYIYQVN